MIRNALILIVVALWASAAVASQADKDFENAPIMGSGQLLLPGTIEAKAVEASKGPICQNFSGNSFLSYYHRMDDRLKLKNIDGHKNFYYGVAHAIDNVFKQSCGDGSVSQNQLLTHVLNACLSSCDSNYKEIKNSILGNQQNDARYECETTCTGFYGSLDSFGKGAYSGIMLEKDCLASPRQQRDTAVSTEKSSDHRIKSIRSDRSIGETGAKAPAGSLR